jgi:hypothetical protein
MQLTLTEGGVKSAGVWNSVFIPWHKDRLKQRKNQTAMNPAFFTPHVSVR